jgi:hypothetical protein
MFKKRIKMWKEAVALAVRAQAKQEPDYIDIRYKGLFAIAIGGEHLFILNQPTLIAIPFGLIRSWEYRVEGYEKEIVYGTSSSAVAASVGARMRNSVAKKEAEKASGLFVRVADVHNPIVQLQTTDVNLLEKWHEILTQTFSDDVSEKAPVYSSREHAPVA